MLVRPIKISGHGQDKLAALAQKARHGQGVQSHTCHIDISLGNGLTVIERLTTNFREMNRHSF